jgi:hypothetical protein
MSWLFGLVLVQVAEFIVLGSVSAVEAGLIEFGGLLRLNAHLMLVRATFVFRFRTNRSAGSHIGIDILDTSAANFTRARFLLRAHGCVGGASASEVEGDAGSGCQWVGGQSIG